MVLSSGAVADLAGNSNSGLSATFKIDLNNPTATITSPADNASTSATSVTVNVNAADTAAGSGVASVMINDGAAMQTSGVYSRSVNLACGKNTITALATDNAGRRSTVAQALVTRTCLTTKGFYQPVDMYDSTGNFIVNTVKGGSTVPLKFEVFNGATEVKEVVVVTSLTYRKVANVTGLPTDEIEETLASGNTALRFDATSDMFIYNWKLPTGIDSYVVTVTLQDGTKIEAMFKTR